MTNIRERYQEKQKGQDNEMGADGGGRVGSLAAAYVTLVILHNHIHLLCCSLSTFPTISRWIE